MHAQGRREDGCVENGALALRLLELAIGAGWQPQECVEFAREAHKFITSISEAPAGQAVDETAEPSKAETAQKPGNPKWGPDLESRRTALQTLADRNLMMKEAAKALGVSVATVASTAHRLGVRFHGRRGRGNYHSAAGRKAALEVPADAAQINGLAITKVLEPLGSRLRRRCPSCNKIFPPRDIRHVLCEDCDRKGHASSSGTNDPTPSQPG